ncbi:MAG TPA: ABC transporter substrate-binding protein [Gaiellaceae bacterium]|nr:ABC transporter substrate-binding protein [Gaiellaceae bacterium]HUJ56443.1 ABC transporter substrate-binding protein [Gaiellaceae bacterium]
MAAASVVAMLAAAGAIATGVVAASAAGSAHAAASTTLVMESSPTNTITDNFNPFDPQSATYLLGGTSLIYEPLLQFDVTNPSKVYDFLATGYKWGAGGKSITFTIRKGVKWSDGQSFSPADVAFTYNLLKNNAAANSTGLPITSATASGDQVTIKFSSAEYTNLQYVANVYIVPEHIWQSISSPATATITNPIGTGPYTLDSYTPQGFTLKANSGYWGGPWNVGGGAPAVKEVEFPTIASNSDVLAALENNSLDWAGNFLSGLGAFTAQSGHKVWFAPVNTNTFYPNLHRWPTNQLPVRQAISLAIDRTAISRQGESGLEPPATNASGLVLPNFKPLLSPAVKKYKLSAKPNVKAAESVLEKAGYTVKGGCFEKGGKSVKFSIIDPSSYTDYAEDDKLAAQELQKAHICATFDGLSVTAWSSDIAKGDFDMMQHWSQTSIAPYVLYDNWLDSKLVTSNRNGNFETLRNKMVDRLLHKLGTAVSTKDQLKYLAPIERYVATQLPVIPTVYGAAFDEYNTSKFTGWPSASNPYEEGQPNTPVNEVVVLHLKPRG